LASPDLCRTPRAARLMRPRLGQGRRGACAARTQNIENNPMQSSLAVSVTAYGFPK